jgi:hypothetical protein
MLSNALSRIALLLALCPLAACSAYEADAPSNDIVETTQALTSTLIASHDDNIWTTKIAFTGFGTPTGWSIDNHQPDPSGSGYRYRRWTNVNTSKLFTAKFGLGKIDLAGNNFLWGMTPGGGLMKNTYPYADDGGTWQFVCTCDAKDFATGANGQLVFWSRYASSQIWRSTDDGRSWSIFYFNPGVFKADVDNNGDLYVIDNVYRVWRLPGGNPNNAWIYLGKPYGVSAQDIAVGNGKIYVVTAQSSGDNNYSVAKYTVAGGWSAGGFLPNVGTVNIHVDVAGRLWGADSSYRIFRYDNIP